MAEIALAQRKVRTRRSVAIGVISIVIGAVILLMARGTSGQVSTFVLYHAGPVWCVGCSGWGLGISQGI
jgi:hypothetical protein